MSAPVPTSEHSDLALRAAVGVALIALAAAALWVGGMGFWLIVAVGGVLMMGEWADLAGVGAGTRRLSQYSLFVAITAMCPWAVGPGWFALGLLGGSTLFTLAVTRNMRLAAGTLYVGLPVLALLVLRDRPQGVLFAFWAMALVWACDVGAYFAGRAIGGPRLAPVISPNKTWAGLVGGVIAAAGFGWALNAYGLPLPLAIATPLLAALAVVGDLYESWIKRRAGVKDSGNLLPGHGGLMDRLDGLVPVAPVAALIVLLSGAGAA